MSAVGLHLILVYAMLSKYYGGSAPATATGRNNADQY